MLFDWVTKVRQLCHQLARTDIGDQYIGQLLSKAPTAEDGIWPCLPVCEVMERIASLEIGLGFRIGVYNARGVHRRSHEEGGSQERELALKYRGQAKRLAFDYPHVSMSFKTLPTLMIRTQSSMTSKCKLTKDCRTE